jgi:hypothetical protein
MSPVLIVSLLFWFFAGICGHIMMYSCDTAVGKGLSINGHFFVLGDNKFSVYLGSLIFAPLTFCVGLIALHEWKEYTKDLRNKFLS